MNRILFSVAALAVVAAIVAGLAVVGGPNSARMDRYNWERLADLQRLASDIDCSLGSLALPDTLEDYQFCGYTVDVPRDPLTDVPYEYRKLNEDTFEVCGTFDFSDEKRPTRFGDFELLRQDGPMGCLRHEREQSGEN